ncbi:MAG: hypothetical protein WBG86_17030 [Polyangiales bacterium]
MRNVLRAVGLLVIALIIVMGTLVWTQTGRDILASWVEDAASASIPGTLRIGSLLEIGLAHPVATEVEVFTPDGDRVMRLERAEVDLGVFQLLSGIVAFDSARVDGAEVVIEVTQDGTTTVEKAFKTEPPPKDRIGLELHRLHFEGVRMRLRLEGEDRFVLRDVRGFMSVWRRDTPGVRVTLGQVQGIFEKPTITGDEIHLQRMDGEVWARESHVVSMQLETRIGDGRLDADFDFYDREEGAAVLTLRPEVGSGAALTAAAIKVRSWFSDKMEVEIE